MSEECKIVEERQTGRKLLEEYVHACYFYVLIKNEDTERKVQSTCEAFINYFEERPYLTLEDEQP